MMRGGDLWVELVCAGFQDDLPESSDGRQDHETHPKDDADLNIIMVNTKKIRTKSRYKLTYVLIVRMDDEKCI